MTLEQAGVAKTTNAPDASLFSTTFAAPDSVAAYFRVGSKEAGVRTAWVETNLTVNGIPLRRQVTRAQTEAWSRADLRLPVEGNYQLTVNLLGTRETKTVSFKREADAQPATPARFLDAWLTTSAGEFVSVQGQAPATSFLATDSNVVAAFKLDQPSTPIVAQWKYQGKALGEPQWAYAGERPENDRGRYIPLFEGYNPFTSSSFSGLTSRDNHLPGDYEVVLTNIATGESRTLKFTLTASSAAAVQNPTVASQPNGSAATSFDSFGSVNANCAATAGLAARDTMAVVWKYQGVVVHNDYRAGNVAAFRQPIMGTATAPLPAGEYEAECFVLGGEAKSVKFTVATDGVAPTPVPTRTPTPRPGTPAPGAPATPTIPVTTRTP